MECTLSETGRDTLISFAGKNQNVEISQRRQIISRNIPATRRSVTPVLVDRLQTFTYAMYELSVKTETQDVNELRYRLFATKKDEMKSLQLPVTVCISTVSEQTTKQGYGNFALKLVPMSLHLLTMDGSEKVQMMELIGRMWRCGTEGAVG